MGILNIKKILVSVFRKLTSLDETDLILRILELLMKSVSSLINILVTGFMPLRDEELLVLIS